MNAVSPYIVYLPRDSIKDFHKAKVLTWRDTASRVVLVALSILKFTGFKFIIRLGVASLIAITNCKKMYDKGYSHTGLMQVVAAITLLPMIFLFPHLAKVATTSQEIITIIKVIPSSIEKRDVALSRECFLKVSRKMLYLASLFYGGAGLSIASKTYYLATLALLMQRDWNHGRSFESSGKFLISAISLNHSINKYFIR